MRVRGSAARNKGMALFPRRIGGQYAMIGRQDGENIWYLTSDDLLTWEGGELFITGTSKLAIGTVPQPGWTDTYAVVGGTVSR